MTRMTRPDCAVMCNLINIHTYIHTYIHMPGRDEDMTMLGQADARRLGGRYAGRTDVIPLR